VWVIIELEGTGSDQKGVAVIQNWLSQGGLLSARATNNRPGVAVIQNWLSQGGLLSARATNNRPGVLCRYTTHISCKA